MRIYVGNLPFSVPEDDLRELFSPFGEIVSINVITDRDTGAPRGFAFVEMNEGAQEAIEALDNSDMGGRKLRVNEARPREQGGGRGGRPKRDRW